MSLELSRTGGLQRAERSPTTVNTLSMGELMIKQQHVNLTHIKSWSLPVCVRTALSSCLWTP